MKHVKLISAAPRKAVDLSVGQVLTVISQLVTVIAAFLVEKEANQVEDY